jgi:predicted O-methyltransferase YrrM
MGGGDMMGRARSEPKIPSFYRSGDPAVDALSGTAYERHPLAHLFALAEGPGRHNFSSMNSHMATLFTLGLCAKDMIVECGVCQGSSTAAFLLAAYHDHARLVWSYDIDPACPERVRRNLSGILSEEMIRFFWHFDAVDSVVAAARFRSGSRVGLLFLDSDHSKGHVSAELAAWVPRMREDGIVAGHDYLGASGVREAVDEFMAVPENAARWKFQLIAADQGIWILWPRVGR